jgi:post-segregation antitoxin (ccd killing protein)
MTDKPEFVDLISDATRQNRRRAMTVDVEPVVKETSRLAHRSTRMEQWRIENLTPWKLKPWGVKHWD